MSEDNIAQIQELYPELASTQLRHIGSGTHGSCYEILGTGEALKVYNDDGLEVQQEFFGDLNHESQTIDSRLTGLFKRVPASLQGTSTLQLIEEESRQNIVKVSYHEGINLETYIELSNNRNIRLAPLNQIRRAISITEIADKLQEARVIHGDFKPANIQLTGENYTKAIKTDADLFTKPGIQNTQYVIGTLEYFAPEYFLQSTYYPNSETDSLGKVLYFLFTGEDYYTTTKPGEIIQMMQDQRVGQFTMKGFGRTPIRTEIKRQLKEIIQSCLDKPENRIKTKEILKKLKEIEENLQDPTLERTLAKKILKKR